MRPFDRGTVEGCLKKFDVVRVSATYLHTQRYAASVGEDRSLGSQLAAIRRIFPGFFPRPEATWSSLRPRFASSTRCHATHRIPKARLSTNCKRSPSESTPGNTCARHWQNRTPEELPSIGNLYAAHRKFRLQLAVTPNVACRLWGWAHTLVAMALAAPKFRQVNAMRRNSIPLTLWAPPCKEKKTDKIPFIRMPMSEGSVFG